MMYWQLENLAARADLVAAADAILQRLLAEADDPSDDAESTLRRLGLVQQWNSREVGLNGESARLLAEVP